MTDTELIALALSRGGTVTPVRLPTISVELPPADEPAPRKAPLVEASFDPPATWTAPVYVVAGDNQRGTKSRIGRSGHERRAVHRCMARQYAALTPFVEAMHVGRTVCVTLTRLGPRKMDYANVVGSVKFIQDAIAERFAGSQTGIGKGAHCPGPTTHIRSEAPIHSTNLVPLCRRLPTDNRTGQKPDSGRVVGGSPGRDDRA